MCEGFQGVTEAEQAARIVSPSSNVSLYRHDRTVIKTGGGNV